MTQSYSTLTGDHARLAQLLFEVGAIKFGAFKLKLHEKDPDAPLSPIYLNLRTDRHPENPGPLTDEMMNLIGSLFRLMRPQPFTRFADIPEAGAPFGDQVARICSSNRTAVSRLTLHKIKIGGKRCITDQVDGDFDPGDTCLLIDELITHADSKIEAISALEKAGLRVVDVLVLVDREQGGSAQLAAAGYQLLSVFTLGELLNYYVECEYIDSDTADQVRTYLAANQAA